MADPARNDFEELELGDYLKILKRRKGWVFGPLVCIVLLAGLLNYRQPDTFSATSRVLISTSAAQDALDPRSQNTGFLSRELSNEISLATSDPIESEVQARLGNDGRSADVSISADADADVLAFDATADSPESAALAANTWAEVYVESKQTEASASISTAVEQFRLRLQGLREDRQALTEPLDDLEDRLARASTPETIAQVQRDIDRLARNLAPELNLIDAEITAVSTSITQLQLNGELAAKGTARVIQVAAAPTESNKAPLARHLLLGGVAGLVLGVGLALLVENLDRTIKTAEDATRVVDVPVLGEIPVAGKEFKGQEIGMAVSTQPEGPIADGYQKVRTALQFAMMGSTYRSLLITSANQSEGKTTTSSNLAWALAAIGSRVVLADIDFRRPRLHEVFKIDQEPGVCNHFIDGRPMHELVIHVDTDDNLVVIPTGPLPPSPGDFLASSQFGTVLDFLKREADFLVLDAPPVLPVSDALAVASKVDATILVVKAGETTVDQLRHTVQSLQQAGAQLAGIVLTGVKSTDRHGKSAYYKESSSGPRRVASIPTRSGTIEQSEIVRETAEPSSQKVPNDAVIILPTSSARPEHLAASDDADDQRRQAKPKRFTRR